jgi:hypothetical protein
VAIFRIASFVNDRALYDEMRASFEAAGFVEPEARYTVEPGEPFEAITRLGAGPEPYVLLVHQDVTADQGHGIGELTRALEELTALDEAWAVAGNAGVGLDGATVRHIADPWGADWLGDLPRRVRVLDENFLVLRTARRPRCSPALSGFHLYGADVCLNAGLDGSSCYVVDFRLSHRSGGAPEGADASLDRFGAHWASLHRRPAYVSTTVWHVPVARSRVVRRVMRHPRVVRLLRRVGAA